MVANQVNIYKAFLFFDLLGYRGYIPQKRHFRVKLNFVRCFQRRVNIFQKEAQKYATEKKLIYIETSAKTGESVPDLFTDVVDVIMKREKAKADKAAAKPAKEDDEEFSFWQKA